VKRDFERGPRKARRPCRAFAFVRQPDGASVLKANARSPMSPTSSRRNSKRRKLLEAKAAGSSGARAGCCTAELCPGRLVDYRRNQEGDRCHPFHSRACRWRY